MRLVLLLAVAVLLCNPAVAASFDCRAASTPVERMVCGNAQLSSLDSDLGAAWQTARAAAPPPERPALLSLQRNWVASLPQSCRVGPTSLPGDPVAVSCLATQYSGRIADLSKYAARSDPAGRAAGAEARIPARAGGELEIGSRAGMKITIVSVNGVGSDRAVIVARQVDDRFAREFCRYYVGEDPVTHQCVKDRMDEVGSAPYVLAANCRTGAFSFGGTRLQFLGPRRQNSNDGTAAPYAVKLLETGELLDVGGASGYDRFEDAWFKLCPRR